MWINAKLWDTLANHSSDLSKKLGRKISVSDLANAYLETALKDDALVKECVEKAKEKRKNAKV